MERERVTLLDPQLPSIHLIKAGTKCVIIDPSTQITSITWARMTKLFIITTLIIDM